MTVLDIKTAITLKPGAMQYLKLDLFVVPAFAKIQLVKVGEKIAIKELKLSRNSIE